MSGKLKIRKEPSATAARERWEPYWQYVGNQAPDQTRGSEHQWWAGEKHKDIFLPEYLTSHVLSSRAINEGWQSFRPCLHPTVERVQQTPAEYLALVKTWLTCFGTKFWSASLWDKAGGPSLSVSAGWGSGWCETPSLARESDIWNTRQI